MLTDAFIENLMFPKAYRIKDFVHRLEANIDWAFFDLVGQEVTEIMDALNDTL